MPELAIYPISDLRIRVEVHDRLRKAEDMDASDIEVKVDHREVSLGGVAWSAADARKAVEIAAAVEGVIRVRDNMLIQSRRGGVGGGFLAL